MKNYASYILSILFIAVLTLNSLADEVITDENLSGTIGPGNYITYHNLTVSFPDSLTIQPGTTIKFAENSSLTVYGCLIAIGNANSKIVFTSDNISEPWAGINFPSNKSSRPENNQLWKSVIKFCHFENVAGEGAVYYTCDNPNRSIDQISFCSFSNVYNAIHILYARQSSIIVNNSSFSSVQNNAITIGNSYANNIQILNDTLVDQSNRFLYIYYNGILNSLEIAYNYVENLNLRKSFIQIDNNQNLNSLNFDSNKLLDFELDATLFPVEESIIIFKDLDNLTTCQIRDNKINSILYDQVLNDEITSFFHIDYCAEILIERDTVIDSKNIKHLYLLEDCQTLSLDESVYESISCQVALFNISADKSCFINNCSFENIFTESGNGCFYMGNVVAMEEITFNNNNFKTITSSNGPCFNINSVAGTIDTLNFINNTVLQNGFISAINGGVGYARLNSIQKFKSQNNQIENCKANNSGGVYFFNASSIIDIVSSNDSLKNIESTNKGGYISIISPIYNENLLLDYLNVDECHTTIGQGGIFYVESENPGMGEIRITNCTFNAFHAGSELFQFDGGGIYIKGNHRKLVFSGNTFKQPLSSNSFPVANNGGILFFEHTGAELDSIIVSDNSFSTNIPIETKGSGGCIYLSSSGNVKSVSIVNNLFDQFHSLKNGGIGYFNLMGTCEVFNINNNEFLNCVADSSGGVFYIQSAGIDHISVNGVLETPQKFSDCKASAGNGGGIYIHSLTQSVKNIDVNYNNVHSSTESLHAGSHGGFMFIKSGGSQADIVNLSNNTVGDTIFGINAGGDGGVFYIDFQGVCDTLHVMNNSITGSRAGTSGGAVYFQAGSLGSLSIQGSEELFQTFKNCRAENGSGGTFYIHSELESIDNITVKYNQISSAPNAVSASADGGVIYIKSENGLVNSIDLSNNKIGTGTAEISAGGNGGAFYLALQGKCETLTIAENDIINCHAVSSGGAIYLKSNGIGKLSITGAENSHQKFTNCQASGSGGSIFIHSMSQLIGEAEIAFNEIQSTPVFNNSSSDGGGIFIKSVGADVNQVSIFNNYFGAENAWLKAGGNGGAIYFDFSGKCHQLDILGNNFTNCIAHSSGGGLYFKSNGIGQLSIQGIDDITQKFINCQSENGSGGAVYINSLDKSINNIDIKFNDLQTTGQDNGAFADGGGMYFKSGDAPVDGVKVSANFFGNDNAGITAGGNGGALYFRLEGNCNSFEVSENSFKGCTSNNSGGAIFFESEGLGQLTIQGTEDLPQVFTNCKSENGSGGSAFVNSQLQSIGSVSITYNSFQSSQQMDNAYLNGGGICLISAGNMVNNVSVSDNIIGNESIGINAGNNGGAFYFDLSGQCTQLDILNNKFYKCSSNGSGGAFYFKSSGLGLIHIQGSEEEPQLFKNCETGNYGGSIHLISDLIDFATINSNLFRNSTAQNGGAISISSNDINGLEFNSTDFANCSANTNGGSIHFSGIDDQIPEIENFEITSCTFNKSFTANGHGGALFFNGRLGKFDCIGSSFIENSCHNANNGLGAAVFIKLTDGLQDVLNFRHDTIQFCSSSSGAVYLENIDLANFQENHFISNFAHHKGAALTVHQFDTLLVSHSLFSGNTSGVEGGAVSIGSGNSDHSIASIVSCDIEFNKSIKGGAIAINNFNSALIADNNFMQNTCSNALIETWGGAIYSNLNDTVTLNNNRFIRNASVIESEQSETQSYGGSLSITNSKKLSVDGNKFYFSNAKSGGAIYINNSNADISSQVFNQNNLYFQNSGVYGGAFYAVMKNQDNITLTGNLFLNNSALYSGGAVDIRNLNNFISTRNIFRNNANEGENTNETTGGSALYSLNVSQLILFNTVFDVNKYSGSSDLQRKPTIWLSNHDYAYIENCTFLKQIPNDRPVIFKQGNTDPVYIKNSIFTKNLNPETPVINENALIEYSFIEGLITAGIDTSHCFDFPEPQFMPDSYILNDNDYDFIDAGNPSEIFNDSIHYPIGKGEELNDLGVSGGRYNLWDEEIDVPVSIDYSRAINVERYNGSCDWYKIYFVLNQEDNFNNYTWYIDDSIFSTDNVNELIKYVADNKLVPVTGIAKNDVSGLEIVGDNTINSYNVITSNGYQILYAGSEYQCGDIIALNDTCPATISNVNFNIVNLKMPSFQAYDYNWSFSNLSGITNYTVNNSSYNNISFNVEFTQDSTQERFITLSYHGSDTECNINFDINCQIGFNFLNLKENIRVTEILPAETLLDPQNVYLELVLNSAPYYCLEESFLKLPVGELDPSWGIIHLSMLPEEIPVEITSVEYTGSSIKFYPDPTVFNQGDYRVRLDHLCNSCGFSYNKTFEIDVKYLGIGNLESQGITIWPNPANDRIYFKSINQLAPLNFDIINSLGVRFGKGVIIPGNKNELDISHFPPGIYFIKFFTDGSQECQFRKIIVE